MQEHSQLEAFVVDGVDCVNPANGITFSILMPIRDVLALLSRCPLFVLPREVCRHMVIEKGLHKVVVRAEFKECCESGDGG